MTARKYPTIGRSAGDDEFFTKLAYDCIITAVEHLEYAQRNLGQNKLTRKLHKDTIVTLSEISHQLIDWQVWRKKNG